MIPMWSFVLFVILFSAGSYVAGLHMGRWYEHKDQTKGGKE